MSDLRKQVLEDSAVSVALEGPNAPTAAHGAVLGEHGQPTTNFPCFPGLPENRNI